MSSGQRGSERMWGLGARVMARSGAEPCVSEACGQSGPHLRQWGCVFVELVRSSRRWPLAESALVQAPRPATSHRRGRSYLKLARLGGLGSELGGITSHPLSCVMTLRVRVRRCRSAPYPFLRRLLGSSGVASSRLALLGPFCSERLSSSPGETIGLAIVWRGVLADKVCGSRALSPGPTGTMPHRFTPRRLLSGMSACVVLRLVVVVYSASLKVCTSFRCGSWQRFSRSRLQSAAQACAGPAVSLGPGGRGARCVRSPRLLCASRWGAQCLDRHTC